MRSSPRIYVASSWRNYFQIGVVKMLRYEGFSVYDFRNPSEIVNVGGRLQFGPPRPAGGFSWREIDPLWQSWSNEEYRAALLAPPAERGFTLDYDAMKAADVGVLVLPAGASAHLEAGFFDGCPDKRLVILLAADYDDDQAKDYLRAYGHSLNRFAPCRACGDLDGCHLWREEARRARPEMRRKGEPELMYKMADAIVDDVHKLADAVRRVSEGGAE